MNVSIKWKNEQDFFPTRDDLQVTEKSRES